MAHTEFKITPKPAMRMTRRTQWATGAKGTAAKAYLAWKAEMLVTANVLGYKLPDNGVLVLKFIMPTERKNRHGSPHTIRPDTDNLIKAFMDAVGIEDKYIHTIVATKEWGEVGKITAYEAEANLIKKLYIYLQNDKADKHSDG